MKKQQFESLAKVESADITNLNAALNFMQTLRKRGLVVKKQEVKAWYGNTTEANHNRLRA